MGWPRSAPGSGWPRHASAGILPTASPAHSGGTFPAQFLDQLPFNFNFSGSITFCYKSGTVSRKRKLRVPEPKIVYVDPDFSQIC